MATKSQSREKASALAQIPKQPFSKILPFILQYKTLIFSSICAYILFNMIGLVMPWLLKISIDRVLPNADYLFFFILAGMLIIVYLVRFVIRYIAIYLTEYTGIRIIIDVRQKVFKHLQSLSLRFYEEYRTGKLLSSVISDAALLNQLMSALSQVFQQFFLLVLILCLLFFINWQMALMIVLTMPLHYLNFSHFRKIIRNDGMHLQEYVSEISANLSENLSGVRVVKSFAREHAECLQFFKRLRPLVELRMKLAQDNIFLSSFNDILSMLTNLATIGFGIRYVQNGSITIGEFVAFYSYVGMVLGPISILSMLSDSIGQGTAGASRIINLLDQIPDIQESSHPIHVNRLKGLIEFDNVSFAYEKDSRVQTIQNFNLTIQPGRKVAFVGPSGSGKSTVTNLLLRFYDVTGGSIRVDNTDIRQYGLESYRASIGVVQQEPFLFSGSIRDNIAYADPDASMEQILHAARLANVDEFVRCLPDGYDTVIGERGASLSGGQKQRLAIARAVLKDPSILILDEATSALDTVSEALVQEALDRLMKDKTTIIIAHRLSTIQNADEIVVISGGKIVEQGSHEVLLDKQGVYRTLYDKQRKMAQEGRA